MHILTSNQSAVALALAEAGAYPIRTLEPGVVLAENASVPKNPIFLRHMCEVTAHVPLAGDASDIEALEKALAPLCERMQKDATFSVQTRIAFGFQPPYKRFDINTALCRVAEEHGAVLDVKAPQQVISVMLTEGMGYMGISKTEDNLSDWAGGMRRYKWEVGQVCRAEFKLLEAIETFGIPLIDGKRALDLGAAPGGWTRIFRRRGLYVTAVDPALLDPRIAKDPRVKHYRGTAQAYFRAPQPHDVMASDMKMDSDEAATLMAEGATCLAADGCAIVTLKLPDESAEWLPRVERAKAILESSYSIVGIRQLFHNRSEVTAYLRPLQHRHPQ